MVNCWRTTRSPGVAVIYGVSSMMSVSSFPVVEVILRKK